MALSKLNNDSFDDTAVHGRRNLIINGAMQVAQRGDVTGKTSSSYGGPDRFRLGLSGAGTHSISQSSTVPSGSGFSNSWKLDCTTADTTPTLMAAQYRFEGQDLQQLKKGTSSAESVTVSFWVRSNVTGTYVLEWRDRDNTRHIAKTYTISAADTFEYKTLTFAGDTSGTIDNNNGHSMELSWWLAASSTYTSGTLPSSWAAETDANRAAGLNVNIAGDTANEWLITGVQLEVGDKATPFEHRSFGEELALCQRYTWKLGGFGSDQYFGAPWLYFDGNNVHNGPFFNPIQMRAQPSMTQVGSPIFKSNGTAQSGFTFSLQSSGKEQCFSIQGVKSGHGLSNVPTNCLNSPSTSDYFIMDAEL